MAETAPGPVRGHPAARWCFTLNHPTAAEEAAVKALAEEAKYLVCGREVGEQGTPHLQGFVNLKKKKRLTTMKKLLPRAHFEPARGSDEDNKKYCSKGGNLLIEHGDPCGPGKRTDLHLACSLIAAGESMRSVAEQHPETFVKYFRGLQQLKLLLTPRPRDFKTEVCVLIGPPGVGKSRLVRAGRDDAYWKPRGKWWDGYDGQEVVILDDFYGWIPFDEMLRIMDRYPLRVETKGGTVEFKARALYITSNKEPQHWYNEEFDLRALFRRITEYHWWDGGAFVSPPPRYALPFPINC